MRIIDFAKEFPSDQSCESKVKEYREAQDIVCPPPPPFRGDRSFRGMVEKGEADPKESASYCDERIIDAGIEPARPYGYLLGKQTRLPFRQSDM